MRKMGEIHDDHHVIAGAALMPAMMMHRFDKPLEAGRSAVIGFHREDGLYPHDNAPVNWAKGTTSMTFTPNRCKWSSFWTASANL